MTRLAPPLAVLCIVALAGPTGAAAPTPVPTPERSIEFRPVVLVSPSPSPAPSRPAVSARPASPRPSRAVLGGIASWYRWREGEAAAGPELRRFLGPRWRGTTVRVCVGSRCVAVRLTDWCGCPGGRVVDLDVRSFAVLAPLSSGLVEVEVFR